MSVYTRTSTQRCRNVCLGMSNVFLPTVYNPQSDSTDKKELGEVKKKRWSGLGSCDRGCGSAADGGEKSQFHCSKLPSRKISSRFERQIKQQHFSYANGPVNDVGKANRGASSLFFCLRLSFNSLSTQALRMETVFFIPTDWRRTNFQLLSALGTATGCFTSIDLFDAALVHFQTHPSTSSILLPCSCCCCCMKALSLCLFHYAGPKKRVGCVYVYGEWRLGAKRIDVS